MIKRQNKLKYIFLVLCSISVVSSLIAAYMAHYYTKSRMGMLRHVIYLNGKWEETFPINIMKYVAIALIISLLVLGILRYYKRENKTIIIDRLLLLITVAISTWTVYYITFYNTEVNRAYYIISFCLVVGTAIQNILYHIHLSIRKNRHIH